VLSVCARQVLLLGLVLLPVFAHSTWLVLLLVALAMAALAAVEATSQAPCSYKVPR
jgi:ABC-type iron transport system FetAB permease component